MYDPDFPTDVDPFGADFEAQDLADASRALQAGRTVALADLSDDEETPVHGDLFDLLYAGSVR